MSFLRVRLAANERKYFKQENESAAARIKAQLQGNKSTPGNTKLPSTGEEVVDVLPEILQHSLPLQMPQETQIMREPSIKRNLEGWSSHGAKTATKAALQPVGHVPETRLGRSKYQLDIPVSHGSKASTANMKRGGTADAAKIQSLMTGLGSVSKAFATATVLVYGGGTVALLLTCGALGIRRLEDIPTKGGEILQPSISSVKETLEPLRLWIQERTARWRLTEEEQRAVGARFARAFQVNTSPTHSQKEKQNVE